MQGKRQQHNPYTHAAVEEGAFFQHNIPSAGPRNAGSPMEYSAGLPAMKIAVKIAIAIHFQVAIMKPEVGHNHNFHFLLDVGIPAEHSIRLLIPP